jgi:hypothetical protein
LYVFRFGRGIYDRVVAGISHRFSRAGIAGCLLRRVRIRVRRAGDHVGGIRYGVSVSIPNGIGFLSIGLRGITSFGRITSFRGITSFRRIIRITSFRGSVSLRNGFTRFSGTSFGTIIGFPGFVDNRIRSRDTGIRRARLGLDRRIGLCVKGCASIAGG